jgi:putative endonuclease
VSFFALERDWIPAFAGMVAIGGEVTWVMHISTIRREKQLKEWKRAWKIALIEKASPYWNDLYATFI